MTTDHLGGGALSPVVIALEVVAVCVTFSIPYHETETAVADQSARQPPIAFLGWREAHRYRLTDCSYYTLLC